MYIAHINIGTNQGRREDNLSLAVVLLRKAVPHTRFEQSPVIESEPWGYESPNRFLNIGLLIVTPLSPTALFDTLQQVEQSISSASHRDSDGCYADRIIDIDLIAVNRDDGTPVIIDTPRLTLPHPRMHMRRFVLEPMLTLDPDWRHPLTDNNISTMIKIVKSC